MKKNLTATLVMTSLMFMSGASLASAQTTATTGDTAALQSKIEMLIKQIEALKASAAEKKGDAMMKKEEHQDSMMMKKEEHMGAMEAKDARQIAKRQLRSGDKGDDVRVLQETLATDSEIYPEGLVTGTFGPLTAKAVKRFQEKHGIESVGEVGPKTLEKLNRFLAEGGAGKSGKIPPGLLRKAGGVVVHLGALNNSGLKGGAMIYDNAEGKAVVSITLHKGDAMMSVGGTTTPANQPAHIHLGSCAVPGAVKYALSPVVGGKSETVLTVSTKDVLAGLPLMINVHKSAEEVAVYVACGDLKAPSMMKKSEHEVAMMMKKDEPQDAMMMEKKVSTVTLNTLNTSGLKGVATILNNAEGKAVVTVEIKKADGMLDDSTVAHPAHIHLGSCAVPGAVKYPLSSVVGGKSVTVLTVGVKDVVAGLPLMINVHKSAEEAAVYVACGDIAA